MKILFLLVFISGFSVAGSNFSGYTIREASIADIDDLVELHYASFHTAHDGMLDQFYIEKNSKDHLRKYWEKFFELQKNDDRFVLVAQIDQRIIGLISAGPIKINSYESDQIAAFFTEFNFKAEISKLYIAPSEQKKGIGSWLLQEALIRLTAYGLTNTIVRVFAQSKNAIDFYQRYGFKKLFLVEQDINRGADVPYALYGLAKTY